MDYKARDKISNFKKNLIPLLRPDEYPAVEIFNQSGCSPLLLVCDHASKAIPKNLDNLGLGVTQLDRHIAYDIGAAEVTRLIAKKINSQAVLASYSRLVIDVNRPPGDPQSILRKSDKTIIPGNQSLTENVKNSRVFNLFEPYHNAIKNSLNHLGQNGKQPALLSIHSFSPEFGDKNRPWDIGVLWNRDPRIAKPLIKKLTKCGLNVGDNLPYSGLDLAYTLNLHGTAPGIANCAIEINQNQIKDKSGIKHWAKILTSILQKIIKIEELYKNNKQYNTMA